MNEHFSVQYVRILDVIFVGPLLLFAASYRTLPLWIRLSLAITGAATIAYNGIRYINVSRAIA